MRHLPRLSFLSLCVAAGAAGATGTAPPSGLDAPVPAGAGAPAWDALPLDMAPGADLGSPAVVPDTTWALCRGPDAIAPFVPPRADAGPPATSPTTIDFDRMEGQEDDRSIFYGDVRLERGTQWLGTDRLVYVHEDEDYLADGDVRYQDTGIRMRASRAEGNTGQETHQLQDVQYQFISQRGSGTAENVDMRGVLGTLHGASFSTCDPQDRKWELRARRLDTDQDAGVGVGRGVTVRVGNVPLLYTPYVSFPLDDRRKSGFLYPTIGYDQDHGVDLFLPYYLNLAPNYDATLTPRIMTSRGLMLGSEFRYLFGPHRGTLEAWVLPDDSNAEDPELQGSTRYEYRANHRTTFNRQWYALADVHRVSDARYFEDFSINSTERSRRHLESRAGLYGRGAYWNTSIEVYDWQAVDPFISPSSERFMELPRVRFNYDRPLGNVFTAGLRSEAVGFDHDVRDDGARLDLAPYLNAEFSDSWWYVRPEVSYRYTRYDLDAPLQAGGDSSPTRSVPIYSVDGGLFFDRDVQLRGRELIHTLEPRLFYLRVPYRDQSQIPIFDTRDLLFSFPQLFRTNRYSGADRQSDANQLAGAVSTRLFEPGSGRELGSLSVGRIHYFDEPRLDPISGSTVVGEDSSFYVVDANLNAGNWTLGGSYQWDPENEHTQLNTYRAQYRFGGNGVVNAAYRYRRGLLEQTDVSVAYPLSPTWRLIGRWAFSLPDDSTLDAVVGAEWQSCCMAVRVLGRHYLRGRYASALADLEKGNAVYLEIELKGLGSFGRKTDELLERSILGYQR